MKKLSILLIISLITFSCVAQDNRPPQEFPRGLQTKLIQYDKLTTAEKLAIDVSNTDVVHRCYDTDLGEFQVNYGLGWVSDGGSGGSIEGITSTGTVAGGDLNLIMGDDNDAFINIAQQPFGAINVRGNFELEGDFTILGESYFDELSSFNEIDMLGTNITGLADGTLPTDAVNKSQLDAAIIGLGDVTQAGNNTFIGKNTFTSTLGTSIPVIVSIDSNGPAAGVALAVLAEGNNNGALINTISSESGLKIKTSGTGYAITSENNTELTYTLDKDGNVTANSFIGDGSQLTGLPLGDVTLAGDNYFTGTNTFDNTTVIGNGVTDDALWVKSSDNAGYALRVTRDGLRMLELGAYAGPPIFQYGDLDGSYGTNSIHSYDYNAGVTSYGSTLVVSDISNATIDANSDAFITRRYGDDNYSGNTPLETTSTNIDLSNTTGNYVYSTTPTQLNTFAISNAVTGGKASVLIDTTGDTAFPTVSGSTLTNSAPFEVDVIYYMMVENNGDRTEHYFVKRDIGTQSQSRYIDFGGRWIFSVTDGWVGFEERYGKQASYHNGNERGSGTNPTYLYNDIGLGQLDAGEILEEITLYGRIGQVDISDVYITLSVIGDDLTAGVTSSDIDEVIVLQPTLVGFTSATTMKKVTFSLGDYVLPKDRVVVLAFKPLGLATSNLYLTGKLKIRENKVFENVEDPTTLTINASNKGSYAFVEGVVSDAVALSNTVELQRVVDLAKTNNQDLSIDDLDFFIEVTDPVYIPSDFNLILGGNFIGRVQPNQLTGYKFFTVLEADNVTITGGTLIGDRYAHDYQTITSSHEWGIMVRVKASHNVVIDGMTLKESTGDACVVTGREHRNIDGTLKATGKESYNVTIKNCVLDDNRRNNVSITDGTNIFIEYNTITNSGSGTADLLPVSSNGTSPRAGIDIEPYKQNDPTGNFTYEYQRTQEVYVRYNTFSDNYSVDCLVYNGELSYVHDNTFNSDKGLSTSYGYNNKVYNNTFKNLTSATDSGKGINIEGRKWADGRERHTDWEIYNNTFENYQSAIILTGDNHTVYNNTITQCKYGVRMGYNKDCSYTNNNITSTISSSSGFSNSGIEMQIIGTTINNGTLSTIGSAINLNNVNNTLSGGLIVDGITMNQSRFSSAQDITIQNSTIGTITNINSTVTEINNN